MVSERKGRGNEGQQWIYAAADLAVSLKLPKKRARPSQSAQAKAEL
jgi:hypothetical protein